MKHITKPAMTLFIIAAVTTALLVMAHALTKEPIEEKIKSTKAAAMRNILPEATDFEEMVLTGCVNRRSMTGVFQATNSGEVVGYIIALSQSGYSGKIDMMVGISSKEDKLAGMRVLRHTETPGLGAIATKESFYRLYDNRALAPLKVVKANAGDDEIQAITSATITTKAITNAVNDAVEFYSVMQSVTATLDELAVSDGEGDNGGAK